MKRTLFLTLMLAISLFSQSQTLATGKNFYYYQRYSSAETFFHDWLKDHPSDAEAWLWLIKSYYAQEKWKPASDSFSLAPATIKDDPFYLVASGSIELGRQSGDNAKMLFDKAVDQTRGKNVAILSAIAEMETLLDKGDMNYALDILQQATKKDRNNASLYLIMGNAYLNLHNGGEAFKAYSTAIEKDRHFAEPYYRLGKLFQTQKNDEMYLDYFNRALQADPEYAPAMYELYVHYVYTSPDPARAMDYFKQYSTRSDQSIQHDYSYIDLLYLTKEYTNAIDKAKTLIKAEGEKLRPRLYKLVAYSFAELKDSTQALGYMKKYFENEDDSNVIAKDCETMAGLYTSTKADSDSALVYFQKAAAISKDSSLLFGYFRQLANLSAGSKDYTNQAKWLGKYCDGNEKASNVDLFNWGIAAYRANDYSQADSVFGLYTHKYPEQSFGYYWQARSSAAIDTAMTAGLAIPHYQRLIDVISKGDSTRINPDSLSARDKKWVIEAYAYMAAYETNTHKDFGKAIEYFDKVLNVDPENADAKKYIPILEANVRKEGGSN